jgi:hypothetical protein
MMKWRAVLPALCLLGIASLVRGEDKNRNVLTSIYAATDPSLQADPETGFWKKARSIFADSDNYGTIVPHHRTEIRSRWTKQYLYVLFVCPYEILHLKPNPDSTHETKQLWNWDVAEMFLGSDFENIRRYKEFEISPRAEWIDLDINLDLPDHTVGWTWNSGLKATARINPKARIWYGAMRVPFIAIGTGPAKAGQVFRANFFRSQGPPDKMRSVAWMPPLTETFHTPERFGRLELAEAFIVPKYLAPHAVSK